MPRTPSPPPLPDRPSHWLANFRYRVRGASGEHLSPEALGFLMGVSGATVRRWESGQASPSDEDLQRFADVCGLSPQQREFVQRLFSRPPNTSPAPIPECFASQVMGLLTVDRPAILVDELFYIRAWNSYFAGLAGDVSNSLNNGVHVLHIALGASRATPDAEHDIRLRQVVRANWLWTAHLGLTEQYTAMVQDLAHNEAFVRHWWALLNDSDEDCEVPLLLPFQRRFLGGACFNVSMSEAVFPPLYRVFIYDPDDAQAQHAISRQLQNGPPQVGFAETLNWSA